MVATLVRPATVETRQQRRWWLCPNCGQKMGEIVGARVLVSIGDRQLRMPLRNEPEQDCPRCGETSQLVGVEAI